MFALDEIANVLFAFAIVCTPLTGNANENCDDVVGIIPDVLENVFATVAVLVVPLYAITVPMYPVAEPDVINNVEPTYVLDTLENLPVVS